MKKKLGFIIDVLYNMIAFGVYIVAMQIIFLPYMSKNLSATVNAKLLTFIVIMNFASSTLGSQLGILYQLVMGRNEKAHTKSEFKRLNVVTSIALAIFSIIALFVMKYTWLEIAALSAVILLANNRLYYQGILRNEKQFNQVGLSNLIYFIGMIAGILFCWQVRLIFWLPILIADICSNIYLFFIKREFIELGLYKTNRFKQLVMRYGDLGFSSFLLNIPGYFDKLLTLPLLGANTMGIYYAGTALSRVFFLAVNPINGVLLPWLSSVPIEKLDDLIKKYIKINIGILVLTFLLGIPFNYISTFILYRHLLADIMKIVVPISLIAAFQVAASLLYTVYLNFYKIKNIKYINLFNIVTFLLFGVLGAKLGGLSGYAYGMALSKCCYWLVYLYLIKNSDYKAQ